MKYSITLLLILFTVVLGCKPAPQADVLSQEGTANIEVANTGTEAGYVNGTWIENYADAIKYAKASNRNVLINFTGSDWCSWCIKLSNEVFNKAEFMDYAKENLVLLKLDYPRSIPQSPELKAQNSSLQSKFGIRGYPTIVLVDANEKEVARTGYQQGGAEKYVAHLMELQTK